VETFQDFATLGRFLAEQHRTGVLTPSESDDILAEFVDVTSAGHFTARGEPVFAPVMADAVSRMIKKALALHPEWDNELEAALVRGRSVSGP
jgi:hypothetical protein